LRAGLDGVGVVLLPAAWVSPLVSEGKLVRLLTYWDAKLTDFCLYYSSRRHVPLKLRTFADFLRKESRRAGQEEQNIAVVSPSRPRSRRSRSFDGTEAVAIAQV
jgi:hypothetical protein